MAHLNKLLFFLLGIAANKNLDKQVPHMNVISDTRF